MMKLFYPWNVFVCFFCMDVFSLLLNIGPVLLFCVDSVTKPVGCCLNDDRSFITFYIVSLEHV
jgi:hypothetical protein